MDKQQKISYLSLVLFLIIFLIGCESAEVEVVPPSITKNLDPTSTLTPSITQSKTNTPTQNSLPEPRKTISTTPEPSLTPSPTFESGNTQVSPDDGMIQNYIPSGGFLMGSLDTDMRADLDEMPQHFVTLDAYWIDQTVVTNAMYTQFLNEMGNLEQEGSTWLDSGDEDVLIYYRGEVWQSVKGYEEFPAVEVSWYGAQAYCHWAGRRLPSEAEWEKAARGEDGRIYPWGDEIDCDKAQYANCSGELLPVGSKMAGASPYGVLGMSGNTWEWTADWYSAVYYEYSIEENPFGPEQGETRSLRGGSWEYDWKHLRAANRRHNGPAVSMHDYAFRCVMDVESKD